MKSMPDDDFRSLRERAETALSSAEDRSGSLTVPDAKALIHDLRVHQIELEMQNEELRASRNELELARDDFARLYNQSPVGYISLDAHGIIRSANQTFMDMAGSGDRDPRGQPLTEFLFDGDAEVFLGRFGAVFRHPEGKTMDVRLKAAGRKFFVRLNARLEKSGKTLLVAVTDITERKLAEERIRSLLDEKQLLLKEVHHRIKNNMNVATAFLTLQAERMDNPEAVAALEDARRRMLSMMIIYDKLYRSEDFRNVSAGDYLTQLLETITEQFPTALIRVDHEIEDFLMDSTVLYPLGIILNELLSNSLKYAFPAGRRGRVRVRLLRDGPATASLSVADDGVGLPPLTDTDSSGGFGMVLVRALVDQIHGSLLISREGGAGFVVTFPVPLPVSEGEAQGDAGPRAP